VELLEHLREDLRRVGGRLEVRRGDALFRVRAIGDASGDTEAGTSTTTDRPEEVGVIVLVDGEEGAVGGNDVRLEHIVDSETVVRREGRVASSLPPAASSTYGSTSSEPTYTTLFRMKSRKMLHELLTNDGVIMRENSIVEFTPRNTGGDGDCRLTLGALGRAFDDKALFEVHALHVMGPKHETAIAHAAALTMTARWIRIRASASTSVRTRNS
jgi:hypothetical protein